MSRRELQTFVGHWLPKLNADLRSQLACHEAALAPFYGMLHYHMGWTDASFQPLQSPAGKRVRPLLLLLACAEVGGDPVQAIPAASAIELIHNFSLIHDDVEDGDETRRHRATVWKTWGVPHAVNAGDGMFGMAYRAVQRTRGLGVPDHTTLDVLDILTTIIIELTEGQYLDMSFEQRDSVTVAEYMRMISGKTSALIGASVAIGASIGGATPEQRDALQRFGRAIGLSFQIQDDILGIWGDPAVTGKAAGNDILRRKKSLPLLYALNHAGVGPRLHQLMAEMAPGDLSQALALLDEAGARSYAEGMQREEHAAGIAALKEALGDGAEKTALFALADGLLNRQS